MRSDTRVVIQLRYQDSKSITLSGELKDEIKEKLILLASVTEQVKNSEHKSGVDDGHCYEVHANPNQFDARQLSLKTLKNQLEALTIQGVPKKQKTIEITYC